MKNVACAIAMLTLVVGMLSGSVASAQTSLSFVAYDCQHRTAVDVARLLRPLLPEANVDTSVQLVVDREQNRLLLTGPAYIHQVAAKLVAEVDQPPAFRESAREAALPAKSMQTYQLPGRLHGAFAQQVASRFGDGIRSSADAGSGNIYVTATTEQHRAIGELAAGMTGQIQMPFAQDTQVSFAEESPRPQRAAAFPILPAGGFRSPPVSQTQAPQQPPQQQLQRQAQANLPPQSQSQSLAATHARFVRIHPTQMDRLQQQIVAIFSSRLAVRTVEGRQVFLLETVGDPVGVVEIEFDRQRHGVLVGGSGAAADQTIKLLESLSHGDERGRAAKVFRLRRDSHPKLRDLIEQGARLDGAGPSWSASAAPMQRLPTEGSSFQHAPANGVQQARFLFQDEDVRGAGAPSPVLSQAVPIPAVDGGNARPGDLQGNFQADNQGRNGIGAVQQFDGVEVESLPDLDVIILRGPDADLAQLAEIIGQLERISRDTQPEVQVVPLEYAQSEALSRIIEEVSPDLVGGRQGKVSVLPLVKPNSMLLIGWGDAVLAVEQLIKQLDRPVAAESQSGVFRLKYASASQVQQTLQTFFSNRGGLGTQVQLAVDPRTNSLIAYAAPRDMEEIAKLIGDMDRPDGEAVNRARVFKIDNALAADVATTLQQAIQAAAGTGDRSAVLELQVFDAKGQTILRSGTLQNVQITPNARNNTLIVSSPVENLELIEELIRQLDTPGGQAQIKVFRIVNGDASALIQTLRSLIPSETGGSTGTQLSAGGEAGLAPLRFSVDTRSNSIIATGSEGDLRIVEALLVKLDQSNSMQRKASVYRLKNSPAIDVAQAINQYLFSRRQLDNAVPGQGNAFAEIEREVVVVPEPVANKLILAATPRYFDEIMELVKRLDESPPQVMIQVLIAEVALNNADEFGVELGLQDSVLFDRSLLGELVTTSVATNVSTADGIVSTTEDLIQAASNIPGFNFNNGLPLGNSGSSTALNNAANVGGQGLSSFALGRTNDQLGFGGLVLSASSKNVSVLLRALRESRRVDVLSRPQIRTLDNQPAFIQVGQRVPRITGSTVNQNGQTNTVELENVGLILGVTPRISPDGKVVMEIDAEKSSLGTEQDGIPVAVSVDGTIVRSPRVDTTTAQATVSAADGETIVLGGLISKESGYVHRTVPILGQIPILEHLFRYDSKQERRTELLIILTPHIIRTAEDNEQIRQREMERMSWCACDVYNLMDDIGYVPEGAFDTSGGSEPQVIYPDLDPSGSVELIDPPEPAVRSIMHGSGATMTSPGRLNPAAVLIESPSNTVPLGPRR